MVAQTAEPVLAPARVRRGAGHTHRISAAIFGVALLVRLGPVLAAGALTDRLEYDDGVYYSAGAHLLRGLWPYDDFVFVHPPAVVAGMLPFAGLGALTNDGVGMASARIAIAVIGSLNAVLLYRLVRRHLAGWSIVAGVLYAVWRLPAVAEHTVMLESILTLLLLLALLALPAAGERPSRRQLLTSAMLLGLAMATKLWIAPVILVLVVHVWRTWGSAAARRWTLGVAGSCMLVCVPFAWAAPRAFVRQVVLLQVGRDGPDGLPRHLDRFADVAGLVDGVARLVSRVALGSLVLVLLVAVAAAAWQEGWARLYVVIAVVQCAEIAVAPVYWYHYFAFPAAMIAVVVVAFLSRTAHQVPRRVVVGATGLVLAALAASAVHGAVPRYADYGPWRAFAAGHRCVWFDSAASAIASDALSRQLERDCPTTVDEYAVQMDSGTAVAYDAAQSYRDSAAMQELFRSALRGSDAAITGPPETMGFDAGTADLLRRDFVPVRETESVTFWVRRADSVMPR